MLSADIIDIANLDISARQVINDIPKGKGEWQKRVPKVTADSIVKRKLFGYSD